MDTIESFYFTYGSNRPKLPCQGKAHTMSDVRWRERAAGLYDPAFAHDACGVGFVADRSGRPGRAVLSLGLQALARRAERGAVDADGRTGDGAGTITQIPHALLADELAERGA